MLLYCFNRMCLVYMNALVYKFTADRGKAMEQIVYWELKRRYGLLFMKNGFECDFITLSAQGNARGAIQVCNDLGDPLTRKREIKGLLAACRKLDLNRG